jgi:hypothetical protein
MRNKQIVVRYIVLRQIAAASDHVTGVQTCLKRDRGRRLGLPKNLPLSLVKEEDHTRPRAEAAGL